MTVKISESIIFQHIDLNKSSEKELLMKKPTTSEDMGSL